MNVLFLTLAHFESIRERNIYTDLLREFVKRGHSVYAVSPVEKRSKKKTRLIKEGNATILQLRIGNTQKTNIIEKGISTVMIEPTFRHAIRKYFAKVKFDLILYSTPPITLTSAIEYVKKRDGAQTYLLLKDIFPQNAVDMGMLDKRGFLYKHFRRQERKLYLMSDIIGCMSPANVTYVLNHNPEIREDRVEVCPNSIEIIDKSVSPKDRKEIRLKYGIPLDKKVFVYGGNLGKPQGVPFLIECLKKCRNIKDTIFLVVGDGTEYGVLDEYKRRFNQENLVLMNRLPKEDYDTLVGACDIGMIFLDHKFTIPNFPSRLLSYLQARLPVFAVTDTCTDIGKIITEGGFGWWCESSDVDNVKDMVIRIADEDLSRFGTAGYNYAKKHYSVERSCETILKNC